MNHYAVEGEAVIMSTHDIGASRYFVAVALLARLVRDSYLHNERRVFAQYDIPLTVGELKARYLWSQIADEELSSGVPFYVTRRVVRFPLV